ncbi:hypothetical protein B4U80_10326 [Leptotrombidium deliense]|uniref:Uncharacterized protein n=1 Tax=Leptotrombidium deliense TaxID=299467 RepID=A0A443SNK2_9ACAR|nr:hypothetical protein B4U80_10326 [Leptotrombidium deliense]
MLEAFAIRKIKNSFD